MTNAAKQIDSPVGTLEWCYIDGEGKEDLQGNPKYQVTVVLDPEEGAKFQALVEEYWVENKPKGAKKAKSLGVYPHKIKDEEASKKEGANVWVETGKLAIIFKTNTTFQNGDKKIVKIFNSKGNEVSLQGKKIGNGSRGRVNGVMDIYDFNKASQGVTFYLNGIQLSKFIEYSGGTNFGAMEDEDGDGFEGISGQPGAIEDESAETTRPRL